MKEKQEYKKILNRPNKKGMAHHLSPLIKEDIKKICKLYKNPYNQKELSHMYKLPPSQISCFVNRKAWSHVT